MRLITYMVTRIGVRDPIEYGHETTRHTAVGWLQQKNRETYDQVQKVPGAIVDMHLILNVLDAPPQFGILLKVPRIPADHRNQVIAIRTPPAPTVKPNRAPQMRPLITSQPVYTLAK